MDFHFLGVNCKLVKIHDFFFDFVPSKKTNIVFVPESRRYIKGKFEI